MELKKIILAIFFLGFISSANAEMIKPAENLSAYDVIKIQLNALKNNDDKDTGIKQTWLFAHPENKRYTGPFGNFKKMISDTSYKILLNSTKFKIKLIEENKNKAAYSVNVDAYDNKRYNLTWLLEKASVSKDCKNCWMTTAVTQPQFIGQLN